MSTSSPPKASTQLPNSAILSALSAAETVKHLDDPRQLQVRMGPRHCHYCQQQSKFLFLI